MLKNTLLKVKKKLLTMVSIPSETSFLGSHDFEDGYALWKNREATEMVNNETKSLPKTQGPSHFVLTAHKELPEVFPTEVLTP